ncbi:hypothetical protein KDL29_12525 [bacterium]|nr:hypothetical protein [bacterium]UNM09104.1 MAG: hypothetical protein H7A35_03420 [Planctomycetales bacterium]
MRTQEILAGLIVLLLAGCNSGGSSGSGTGLQVSTGGTGNAAGEDAQPAFEPHASPEDFLEMEAILASISPPKQEAERDWLALIELASEDQAAAVEELATRRESISRTGHEVDLLRAAVSFGYVELADVALASVEESGQLGPADKGSLLAAALRHGDREMMRMLAGHGATLSYEAQQGLMGTFAPRDKQLLQEAVQACGISDENGNWLSKLAEMLPYMTYESLQAVLAGETHFDQLMSDPTALVTGCLDESRKLQLLLDSGYTLPDTDPARGGSLFQQVHLTATRFGQAKFIGRDVSDESGVFRILADNGQDIMAEDDKFVSPSNAPGFTLMDVIVSWPSYDKRLYPLLAEWGVDLNRTDNLGRNALFHLLERDDYSDAEIVALVELGMDPLLANDNGYTPLYMAIDDDRRELAEAMYSACGREDIVTAGAFGQVDNFASLLEELDRADRELAVQRAMLLAASLGDRQVVLALEEQGTAIPLQALCRAGMLAELEQRLESGEFSVMPGENLRPLQYAAAHGDPDCLAAMLQAKNLQRDYNPLSLFDALVRAVQNQRLDNAAVLLDNGAPVEIPDGYTGLVRSLVQAAAQLGEPELLGLMLEHGADPDRGLIEIQAHGILSGKPALQSCLDLLMSETVPYSQRIDMEEVRRCVELLLEHDANVDYYVESMNPITGVVDYIPSLQYNAKRLDPDLVELLAEHAREPMAAPVRGKPGNTDWQYPPALIVQLAGMQGVDGELQEAALQVATEQQIELAMYQCLVVDNADLLARLDSALPAGSRQQDAGLVTEAFRHRARACLDALLVLGYPVPDYRVGLDALGYGLEPQQR